MITYSSSKPSKRKCSHGTKNGTIFGGWVAKVSLPEMSSKPRQLISSPLAEIAMTPYPGLIGNFYFHYSMLVLNSFGLQNAMERSAVDIGHFFARCHSSATACALMVRDDLGPRGFLKYSPDSHFVMISYALLSLLKVRGIIICLDSSHPNCR